MSPKEQLDTRRRNGDLIQTFNPSNTWSRQLALNEDLEAAVKGIFDTTWSVREGRKVPEPEDVALGNDAVKLDATVLYADLAESTQLVNGYHWWFAAEVYKAYLHCASKIVKRYEGIITAFDGDRIMAIYIGDSKNSNAVRSALAIEHAVVQIINPVIKKRHPNSTYQVAHAVGVDTSVLHAARTGIRGSNDLVWVGRAANIAAKLCGLRVGSYATWITKEVYDNMSDTVKLSGDKNMWEWVDWATHSMRVYRSRWHWEIS